MKNLLVTFGMFSLMLVLTSFKGISNEIALEEMNYAIVSVENDTRGGQSITPPKKVDDPESVSTRGGQSITPPKKVDDPESISTRGGQSITPPKKVDDPE